VAGESVGVWTPVPLAIPGRPPDLESGRLFTTQRGLMLFGRHGTTVQLVPSGSCPGP
jgi:hypothetical protein